MNPPPRPEGARTRDHATYVVLTLTDSIQLRKEEQNIFKLKRVAHALTANCRRGSINRRNFYRGVFTFPPQMAREAEAEEEEGQECRSERTRVVEREKEQHYNSSRHAHFTRDRQWERRERRRMKESSNRIELNQLVRTRIDRG